MRFTQEFIEKVRDANNIAEIIGQHTELKGNGHRLTGRCPFPDHSDKSPSFSVTEDNQLYFCYGCKKGGNIFTFLETFNGMSFPESVEFLARRSNIALPERDEKEKRAPGTVTHDQKDLLLKVNKAAAVFYHQQLKSQGDDSPVKKYLVKRGLNDDIVEKFRLGVSLEAWQGLAQFLEEKKVPLALAEKLGLLRPKKNPGQSSRKSDAYYDLFRERLMFPIFSPTSDVIGFGGRTLGDALPKYVNSSDSPVFNKGKIFYGLHETGKFIRAQDEAIVVEGYMDAISLYAAGIKNVVAILGTAFTPDHAKVLKRYTLNIKMLLDGDEAGISAAERSLPILLGAGLMPKGFILPDKSDPDDFVKQHGADALRTEIARAPELYTLLLTKRWMTNYHASPSEKVRVLEEAAMSLNVMVNRQLADLYVLETARQLDVDVSWIRRALASAQTLATRPGVAKDPRLTPKPVGTLAAQGGDEASSDSSETDDAEEAPPLISLKGAPKEEAFVVSLLLYREGLMRDLNEAGVENVTDLLSHSGLREVLKAAGARYKAAPDEFAKVAGSMISRVDLPGVLACSVPLVPPDAPEGSDRRLMADYLQALRGRILKSQTKAIASKLRDGASTEALQEFQDLTRDRMNRPKSSDD